MPRGLTSHARHFHEMDKDEIEKARIKKAEKENGTGWKIVGGIGAVLLAIITAGRIRLNDISKDKILTLNFNLNYR